MARLDTADIVIAGGGIGGLTLALALLARGIRPLVLEQATELREVGAGVQISPNGTRLLASLGLLDELRAIAVEPEGKEIRLWSTGETWPLFDLGPRCEATYGFPYLMVHRGDLQAVLAGALRRVSPDALRLGETVTDVSQDEGSVHVRLESGGTVSASLLVGADGVHSRVRAALFGPAKARFTGCLAWRGVVPIERLPAHLARKVGVNWVGPGRHVVTYPLRGGKLVNFVGVVERDGWETESWTARGTHEDCARDFEGWHPDVHALIDNIDTHYRWALLTREPITTWCQGRVALLGDACHPMLPFMAQGAVMAIEDAVVLARCLDAHRTSHAKAFAAYEEARVGRANRCVVAADRNRQLFHAEQLAEPADAARYVETQWTETKVWERYEWLFSHDALSVPLGEDKRHEARLDPNPRSKRGETTT